MSYDLAVWEGPHPADDIEAELVYEELCTRYLEDEYPPTERITAYVAALVKRWPEFTEPGGERSPWAVAPLITDARGPVIVLPLRYRMHEMHSEVCAFAAEVATSMGLVCYDLQTEQVRSSPVAPPLS